MRSLLQDIRYGIRMMAKNRGFTAVAMLVLALGIGANSVIFSVINAVLLRPQPFDHPDRLIILRESRLQQPVSGVAAANFLDWRDRNRVFESIAAYRQDTFNLTGDDRPERVWGVVTTASLFPVLGVKPVLGRVFLLEEENLGGARVAVISEGLWSRRFASDAGVIGQKITANGEPLTIVGVMPVRFKFPEGADLWVPPRQGVPEHPLRPAVNMTNNRDTYYLHAIGRLKPGASLEQARADMEVVARGIEEQHPDENQGRGVSLVTLREENVGDIRPTLLVLFAAVGFVLLIACANIANLLLARAATRQKEIAIRTALGAGRFRLVRQLLTESLLLATLGGGLGLMLALWGINPLVSLMPANIYGVSDIRIDGQVLGFTIAVSLLTGVVFGLIPALQATRTDLNESLKEGGRSATAGSRRNRVRGLLVVSEIALSLVLLIGAGLMIKSFVRLQEIDPGFDARNKFTMYLSLPSAQYSDGRRRADFFRQVVERLEALPGVQSAAAISRLPLTPGNSSRGLTIEGRPNEGSGDGPAADYRVITPDYFRAMGIPLLKGRDFAGSDGGDSPGVAIINETMARRYWPDQEPLGKRVRIGDDERAWMEVVGVVGDVKHFGLDAVSRAELYVLYFKDPWPFMTAVVHSASDAKSVADAMRGEVWAVDKDLPVPDIKRMEHLLAESVSQRRFNMLLLGIFAAVAMVLAAVGIYGVMSYSVTQRTREIGIRMALGAKRGDVVRLIVAQGMLPTAIGLTLGLAGALALTRLMASLLFGVSATDPATFAAVSLLLSVVSLAACYIPARRATKVDPMVALRHE